MKPQLKYSLVFGGLGIIFFVPFLGGVHLFDWDEINFAEISREMIVTQDYLSIQVDFQPFYEKPPFFFWLQALSMHIFGINEYAARFPNAVCGIITLILVFNIGNKLFNTTFGIAWAGIYLGSILPHLYFKSGIIDPYFNLFIFLGLYFFILFYWRKEKFPNMVVGKSPILYLILSGFFVGLAMLTKGPVAFLIVCLTLTVYWATKRLGKFIEIKHFLIFIISSSFVMLTWYGMEWLTHGYGFIAEFVKYQYHLLTSPAAGHGGFFGYHFVVLLIGCFPASIFCIRAFVKTEHEHEHQKEFKKWMMILFWVVLILFSIVKSKIIHYSSLAYFPLTFLATITVTQIIEGKIQFGKWLKWGLVSIALIVSSAFIVAPFVGKNIEVLKPLLEKDPFAAANLQAEIQWTGWESFVGIFFLMIILLSILFIYRNKKAFGFKILFGGTAAFVMIALIVFVKKIEGYSQNAAVTYFQGLEGKDCYTTTLGYKSYVHLFYSNRQQTQNKNSNDKNWLLNGDIDKDVYIVTKINKEKELQERSDIVKLGEKNGFVFLVRRKNY